MRCLAFSVIMCCFLCRPQAAVRLGQARKVELSLEPSQHGDGALYLQYDGEASPFRINEESVTYTVERQTHANVLFCPVRTGMCCTNKSRARFSRARSSGEVPLSPTKVNLHSV